VSSSIIARSSRVSAAPARFSDADQIAAAFHRQGDEVGRKMTEQSWQKEESNPGAQELTDT